MNTIDNPNAQILDQQFLEPVAEVAGLKLQPFSPGVLTAARKLDLKFIVGAAEDKQEISKEDQQYQLMAVLFMLASPRNVVLKLVKEGKEAFREAVEQFEYLIPFAEIPKAVEEIQNIVAAANAATVRVVPKPQPEGASAENQPPPNS